MPLPPTSELRWDAYQAFFDRYLMGLDNGFGADGPVEVFTVGRGTDGGRHLAGWPPPAMRPERWYLRAGGLLSPDPPTTDEAPDRYRYDPADPVAETVGRTCWAIAGQLGDRRAIEERADVLVYTSLALTADLELTGPLVATLHAASSAVDTDFTVTPRQLRAPRTRDEPPGGEPHAPAASGRGARLGARGSDRGRQRVRAARVTAPVRVGRPGAGHLAQAGRWKRGEACRADESRRRRGVLDTARA